MRGEDVGVTELAGVAPEVADLNGTLLHERAQHKVGGAQRHTQPLGQFPLREARIVLQRTQYAESGVFL